MRLAAESGGRVGLRIGLLGGSFNPAHEGHLHISRLALQLLRLHELWWLVSPLNPLKSAGDVAPLEERLEGARRIARHPLIRITDIETQLGTRYTVDTLAALRRRFPRARFVWIMGADILPQLPRWKRWRDIFRLVPIAVFGRAPYSSRALAAMAALTFARNRLHTRDARTLADRTPPAWIFFHTRLHPASATSIRAAVASLPPAGPRRSKAHAAGRGRANQHR
jgi:nicotinate-nucleotide adenylyltransferase